MELNVTRFFAEACPKDYSASQAELGPSAAADTWRAANDDSAEYPLLDTDEKRDAFRAFIRSTGGWDAEEIAAWSDVELNALCIQCVAGDIRECRMEPGMPDDEWQRVRRDQEAGRIPSNLYRAEDGAVYFNLSE